MLLLVTLPQAQYLNPNLPFERRADDLVSRMTLDERVSQMSYSAPAIARLGIPAYNWWNECLHGVARAGIATVFPQSIGLGATWDPALIHDVATAISDEARAKYHDALRKGVRDIYNGLTYWSPNINIFRDPRWGRGQETYGEDPFLTGTIGTQFVRGLQGNNPKYLKLVSTPKHFAVHSGPEPLRNRFDAIATKQDMFATYLPHFEMAVRDGGAWSVMGAYNRVNGVPCNSNPFLLQQVLRDTWKFKGYVVSDCGAITNIYADHHFVPSKIEAVVAAVKAGCDLECDNCYPALVDAVQQGLISEAEVNRSVKRLMEARLRLGMFDADSLVPYSKIPISVVNNAKHRALALRSARESLVLLKNDGTLPLKKSVKRIAVIGPNADEASVLLGNYNGTPAHPVTPLRGIEALASARGAKIVYSKGCGLTGDETEPFPFPMKAEYFTNLDARGEPKLVRDEKLNFDWGDGAPQGMPADNFSVRWTCSFTPPTTGEYTFDFTHDDGVRVWLDRKLIMDDWRETPSRTEVAHATLTAGKPVAVRIEYFEKGGQAVARFGWRKPGVKRFDDALAAVRASDVAVMVLGISTRLEDEGLDRTDLGLPKIQEDLLKAVRALGKPVVIVLLNGGPISLDPALANAILDAWYPGEAGGTAIAEALFGLTNPGGRLPVTVIRSLAQVPTFTDYSMKGRTYRYMNAEPLYRFGYGLSYTRFEYSRLRVQRKAGGLLATVRVRNTGKATGDEVVQLFLSHTKQLFATPIRELKAFKRITLKPGEVQEVQLPVAKNGLGVIDANGTKVFPKDALTVSVGGGQPSKGATQVLTTVIK